MRALFSPLPLCSLTSHVPVAFIIWLNCLRQTMQLVYLFLILFQATCLVNAQKDALSPDASPTDVRAALGRWLKFLRHTFCWTCLDACMGKDVVSQFVVPNTPLDIPTQMEPVLTPKSIISRKASLDVFG